MEGNETTQARQNNSESCGSNKKNKTNKVLVFVILILVAIVGIMAYQFLQKNDDEREVYDGRATFVSEKNVDEVRDWLEEEVEDAYYTTCMTYDWSFYDGKSVSTDAYVENPTENTRIVYFDVNLANTGELVYSSPYLPVGEALQGFALDVELSTGDYPAVVTYHLVDDEHQEITTVAVSINIHVLN